MKTKTYLTSLLVLRSFPDFGRAPAPGQPPLSRLDLPSQTVNGITAHLESYYADASRLVFVVRVNSEKAGYFLDNISISAAGR